MRIDHCKYVIAVAESCNIRQTAERFYITQQGLSQAIKAVERELDVQLFTRTGNALFPTAEGKVILERLKRVVDEYDSMIDSLSDLSGKDSDNIDPVTVYVTPNVCNSVLSKIMSMMSRKSPHPLLRIVEDLPLDIADNPERLPADSLGIITIPEFLLEQSKAVKRGEIVFEEYARCPLMACVAQSSPLASLPCITRDIIAEMPLAIYPSEINMVRHILSDDTIEPNILINSANITLSRNLIAKEQALGFTTTLFERNVRPQPLTLVPLEAEVDILWGCIYGTEHPLSRWAKETMMVSRMAMQGATIKIHP